MLEEEEMLHNDEHHSVPTFPGGFLIVSHSGLQVEADNNYVIIKKKKEGHNSGEKTLFMFTAPSYCSLASLFSQCDPSHTTLCSQGIKKHFFLTGLIFWSCFRYLKKKQGKRAKAPKLYSADRRWWKEQRFMLMWRKDENTLDRRQVDEIFSSRADQCLILPGTCHKWATAAILLYISLQRAYMPHKKKARTLQERENTT